MDDREREVWTRVIEAYKGRPHMWDKRSIHYFNRDMRQKTFALLFEIYCELDYDVDISNFKKKFENMRTTFAREYKKVKKSIEEGMTGEEVHVPSLWYYDLLKFIMPQPHNSSVRSNDDDSLNGDDDSDCYEDDDEDEKLNAEKEDILAENQYAFVDFTHMIKHQDNTLIGKKLKSNKRKLQEVGFSPGTFPKQPKTSEDQRVSVFGEYVVERLRSMPDDMSIICRKIINDAIFEAEIGALTHNSKIVN